MSGAQRKGRAVAMLHVTMGGYAATICISDQALSQICELGTLPFGRLFDKHTTSNRLRSVPISVYGKEPNHAERV